MVKNGSHERGVELKLVGLVATDVGYFGFGDPEKRIIDARAVERSIIIHEIAARSPYGLLAKSMEAVAFQGANAFILGYPAYRYGTSQLFDAAVQFACISRAQWERLRIIPSLTTPIVEYIGTKGPLGV